MRSVGLGFVKLKDWGDRDGTIADFLQWSNRHLQQNAKDATVFVANNPTIRGLSQFGGFEFYLEDRAGLAAMRSPPRRASCCNPPARAQCSRTCARTRSTTPHASR